MPELTGNAHLFLERKGMECGRTLGGGDETAELEMRNDGLQTA